MKSPDIFQGLLTPDQLARRYKRAHLIQALEERIQDGTIPANTKLPPLTKRGLWIDGVFLSESITFKVYAHLVNQGFAYRINAGKNRGTFVRDLSNTNTASGKTLSEIVRDDLTGQFATGELRSGMPIPSVPDLMAMFEVSETPVKTAIKELTQQGLLIRRRGNGNFVTDKVQPDIQGEWRFVTPIDDSSTLWERGVRRRGYDYEKVKGEISNPEEEEIPFITHLLQLPQTADIVSFIDSRHVLSPVRPQILFDRTTFYMERGQADLIGAITPKGRRSSKWRPDESIYQKVRDFLTKTPTRKERILFRIPEGVPLLKKRTVLFSRYANQPVYAREQVFPGNRGVFREVA